jgi:O-methyltransferase involved in polyketide biosynthesis
MKDGHKTFTEDQALVNREMGRLQDRVATDCASWASGSCGANVGTQAYGYFKSALNGIGSRLTGAQGGDQARELGKLAYEFTPIGGANQVYDDYKTHGISHFASPVNAVLAIGSVLPFGNTLREGRVAVAAVKEGGNVAREASRVGAAFAGDSLGAASANGARQATGEVRAAQEGAKFARPTKEAVQIHYDKFVDEYKEIGAKLDPRDVKKYLKSKGIPEDSDLARAMEMKAGLRPISDAESVVALEQATAETARISPEKFGNMTRGMPPAQARSFVKEASDLSKLAGDLGYSMTDFEHLFRSLKPEQMEEFMQAARNPQTARTAVVNTMKTGLTPPAVVALEGRTVKAGVSRAAHEIPSDYGAVENLNKPVYRGMSYEEFEKWLKNRGFPNDEASGASVIKFVSWDENTAKAYASDRWKAGRPGVLVEFHGAKGAKKTGGSDSQNEYMMAQFESFTVKKYVGPEYSTIKH